MNRSTETIMVATLRADDSISDEQVKKAVALLKGKEKPTNKDDERRLLFTQAQAARILNCSRYTVLRMVKDETIKTVKVRGLTRYKRKDIEAIARLFDHYRQFYQCKSDLGLCENFIGERLRNNESTIFIALDNEEITRGFVQLYPSYCSIDAGKILILHDLFVDDSVRNQGIGKLLMDKATEYAGETGAVRLDLLTDKTNYPGQALYGKLGYRKTNEDFFAYSLKV